MAVDVLLCVFVKGLRKGEREKKGESRREEGGRGRNEGEGGGVESEGSTREEGGNLKILFSSALYMQMLTLQCQRAAVTLEAPTSLDHSHHCCKTHTHTNTHAHTKHPQTDLNARLSSTSQWHFTRGYLKSRATGDISSEMKGCSVSQGINIPQHCLCIM